MAFLPREVTDIRKLSPPDVVTIFSIYINAVFAVFYHKPNYVSNSLLFYCEETLK